MQDSFHLVGGASSETVKAAPLLSFEIINPSDPYTFTAPSLEIAALVTIFLGHGQYSAKSLDTPPNDGVPFLMFGGSDTWFQDHCGCTLQESADRADKLALADAFDSVAIPGGGEHTSMNNIGKRAKDYAAALREQAAEIGRAA